MINIKRGLDLPITGSPEQRIEDARPVRSVALVGFDYHGMKPTMEVQVGDRVQAGQILFSDKKNPGVLYTAPASGVISAINRGEKRVLQSVVIDVEGDDAVDFGAHGADSLEGLDPQAVRDQLVRSGLWTALRTRPYSKVPAVDATPSSIFVTAIDTHPLSADPAVVLQSCGADFENGLKVLARLAGVWLCKAEGASIPGENVAGVRSESFAGPHPAGLPGTHIHMLDPVSESRQAWHINYQDVVAVGRLFTTGRLSAERVVALGGPQIERPRLLRTVLGANLEELVAGEMKPGNNRIISGSVLGGRLARGPVLYLGRYHLQVSVLLEGTQREILHYLRAGANKHSILNIFISKLAPSKLFNFTTSTNGSARAMIPVGNYEEVMPLDILPTQLLRSLIVGDTEMAQKLGCLELDEEDLALCSYVCAGKYEYGPILRDNLTRIEKEG
ncbi:Na(+)-translocating NADH-quinone reductase subunit A [Halopseudomonas bauzanensis]|uniref:Na(+)-translocating NADH-quinone reductase subunit A n=1 Tax=Halopseudomonas bauzanensis TaxID=653930 RepID=A0A1H9REG6_9GAMM|nr:Na(+)-translocating NADH-quinone reductase subunit A [Halopseudomonas bauzanensis]SER70353.1 Na+-transporting NADH:ubiquinone oxidoreductase subunit A [Halopseudomonas bauzanensis]SFL59399.1 Na+-transporting NADH:ubiquinone oxidoreductase subunit A [Halopseudomonas bauzanensis]